MSGARDKFDRYIHDLLKDGTMTWRKLLTRILGTFLLCFVLWRSAVWIAADHGPSVAERSSPIAKERAEHFSSLARWDDRLAVAVNSNTFVTTTAAQSITDRGVDKTYPAAVVTESETSDVVDKRTPYENSATTKKGYMLALDYWEQQTAGARNLQDLQCLAARYNLSVVEPIISNSYLISPFNVTTTKDTLWFSDFYDIDDWNRQSLQSNHTPLKSWSEFLADAPNQNVILAAVRYSSEDVSEVHREMRLYSHIPRHHRLTRCCSTNWTREELLLNKRGFNVVRNVCFNFGCGDTMSEEEFQDHLFGSLTPSSTTVVFTQWRSTFTINARFHANITNCGLFNSKIHLTTQASPRLLQHVRLYQEKYFSGAPYIAIHLRMEKVQLLLEERRGRFTYETGPLIDKCLSSVKKSWERMKILYQLRHTFLAVDIGRFATRSLHMYLNDITVSHLEKKFEDFFVTLYGNSLTVGEWENSFVEIAGTDDPGYVAALQKMLAAQANCVILIGGGSFQSHILNLYYQFRPKDRICATIYKDYSYKLEN